MSYLASFVVSFVTFNTPYHLLILIPVDEIEAINTHLSLLSSSSSSSSTRNSSSLPKTSSALASTPASASAGMRSITLSRLLAVVLQAIQMTANIVYAMLQCTKQQQQHHEDILSFPYSLVQKVDPIIHDFLPLFVNLCTKIVQSWEQAQAVQKDYQSLREFHDVQEKVASRPGSSSSSRSRSDPVNATPTPMSSAPQADVIWMDVEHTFLLSVLVEATVLMGTIMSLPSVHVKPSVSLSGSGSLSMASAARDASGYMKNSVALATSNVLTMSDRW